VSHPGLINHMQPQNLQPRLSNEYKPQLLEEFRNMLIIVYQRHSFSNTLILDKSSQDPYLRGFPFGIKVSLHGSGSVPSTFNVSLNLKSSIESKENSLYQRRWNASHTCDCNRAIHKADIQRITGWGFELTDDK
jgi:hypothetical protein